jgi:DNA-binding MarR family transcriptional regulator
MNQTRGVDRLVELLFKNGQLIREHTKPSEKLNLASFVQLHILQFIAIADSKKPINPHTFPSGVTPHRKSQKLFGNQPSRAKGYFEGVGVNMSDVANHLNITPPSATSLVNNLVKNTKLKRVSDASDRRIVRLQLTPSGLRALREGRAQLINRLKGVFEVLNQKEQKQMIAILQKISKQYKI